MQAVAETVNWSSQQRKSIAEDNELERILARYYEKRGKIPAIRMKVPYGFRIFENGRPFPNDTGRRIECRGEDAANLMKRIISDKCLFLVTRGVFEVFTYQKVNRDGKEVRRIHSNTLLSTGGIFGLFERFTDIDGHWTIASGLQSFVVTNPIADQKIWDQRGATDASALRIGRQSELAFYGLLEDVPPSEWHSEVVIFAIEHFDDSETQLLLTNHLESLTVQQLVSVIRQNPTMGFSESAVSDFRINSLLQYFDGAISGHIPVLTRAIAADQERLPLSRLQRELEGYAKAAKKEWASSETDIFVPTLLSDARRVGVHFNDLIRRFDEKPLTDVLRKYNPSSYATFLEKYGRTWRPISGDESQLLRQIREFMVRPGDRGVRLQEFEYITPAGIAALIQCFSIRRPVKGSKHWSIPMKYLLYNEPCEGARKLRGEIRYDWPRHLSSAVRIERINASPPD